MRIWVGLLSLLVACAAWAHDADIVYAQIARGADGLVTEQLTMTDNTLLQLAPIDADGDGLVSGDELSHGTDAIAAGIWDELPLSAQKGPCTRQSMQAGQKDNYLALSATFRCGEGELSQTFRILSVLPPTYRVVLGAYGQGQLRAQGFAEGSHQTLTMLGEGEAGTAATMKQASPSLGGWISLGVTHIFGGIDHLAFLLAVLLVGGSWKRILTLVTSFTLAHSITLGATALGLIRLSPSLSRWVEVAIAFSIVWVALENLLLRQHRHRVFLTFAFGLVHGFGFASVLMEMGLGDSAVSGLFGFNLGVELGQACVVLVAYPVLRLLSRRAAVNQWMIRLGSGAIFAAGVMWMVLRIRG